MLNYKLNMGSLRAITTRASVSKNEFALTPTHTQTSRSTRLPVRLAPAAKILIALFIVFSTATQTFSQSVKEFDKKWELAKGHYSDGNYDIAVMLFQSLTPEQSNNKYVEYANYYTALCYFKEGKLFKSREYLLQLKNKYPNWDKQQKATYLLANIAFINQKYEAAIMHLVDDESQKTKNLKLHYLSEVESVHLIKILHQKFPKDAEIATVLAYHLANQQPLMEVDKEYIYSLISQYKINGSNLKAHLESSTENHFKDTFNLALIYPFNVNQLKRYKPNRKNQFVIDHYWGMKLAVEMLAEQNISLKLNIYDTRNDTNATKRVLMKKELKQADVAIGSVYRRNMKHISSFCNENQIICFNPFSNYSRTITDSGFVFMYNPTYEMIGVNSAQLVLDSFPKKEIIVLCFNAKKDTIIANSFIDKLESDSNFKSKIHKVFVDRGDDVLKPLSRISRSFKGVVFAPSQNTSIASALTSWLIMRELETPIIGNSTWFNSQEFNIVNFNKREAYFFDEKYVNYKIDSIYNFKERYIKRFNVPPTDAAYKGFDLAVFLGNNLTKYGKYFNQALWNMESQEGVFYPQFNYNNSYCNSFVPILKLNDFQLVPTNYSVESIADEKGDDE